MAELTDDAFRLALKAKMLSNISACTVFECNAVLKALFPGRGKCYVEDLGAMAIRYTFEFTLTAFEKNIIENKNVLPKPCGVSIAFNYI